MSPIYGLTDSTPTFREVGRIRKGGPKTDPYKPGPNLDHFRATFRDDEPEAAAKFVEVYGDTPTIINCRLAFNDPQYNWDAWYTAYLKGGMLGMADGVIWHYLRDYRTQQVLIKNAQLTQLGAERGVSLQFDPETPVYYYKSQRQKQDVPVYAKPEGKLRIVIPELGRLAFMIVLTHSLHDIANISAQLQGIQHFASDIGIKLSHVPLVLTRRMDQISKPIGNGRGMVDEWLIHLEILPDFAPLALRHIEREVVRELSDQAVLPMLPAESEQADEEYLDVPEDEEITPGPAFSAPQLPDITHLPESVQAQIVEQQVEMVSAGRAPEPKVYLEDMIKSDAELLAEQGSDTKRPFTPAKVKSLVQGAAAKFILDLNSKRFQPRDAAERDEKFLRGIVAGNMEECFANEPKNTAETCRHMVTNYLFGKASLTECDMGELVALKRWLNSRPDSGGYWTPDGMACKEANLILQQEMLIERTQ